MNNNAKVKYQGPVRKVPISVSLVKKSVENKLLSKTAVSFVDTSGVVIN